MCMMATGCLILKNLPMVPRGNHALSTVLQVKDGLQNLLEESISIFSRLLWVVARQVIGAIIHGQPLMDSCCCGAVMRAPVRLAASFPRTRPTLGRLRGRASALALLIMEKQIF